MIYSCFPTTGKTYLAKHNPQRFVDLESSQYQWLDYQSDHAELYKGKLHWANPEWPNNYVKAIIKRVEKGRDVLISSQPAVLNSLRGLDITYVYYKPTLENLNLCQFRMRQRGNSEDFIELVLSNFYKFNQQMKQHKGPHIELDAGHVTCLSDYFHAKFSIDEFIAHGEESMYAVRPYDVKRHTRNTIWYNRLVNKMGKTTADMAKYLGMPEQKVIDVIYGALDTSPEDTHRVEALLNDTVGPYNSWN